MAGEDLHPGGGVLSIKDATFTVNLKKFGRTIGTKQIVKSVTLNMRSGETIAIMGPSGAGKTTFMDLLTLEGSGGIRTGSVQLNEKPLTVQMFKRYCAYVPQFDAGWAYLTCRESLTFAARFFMTGKRAAGRTAKVDELIKTMGLEVCAKTIVGHEFLKGLSGGQKRRLSLGIAFLKDPLCLFLDEVTSGLDAASAYNIAHFMQDIAKQKDVIIACTIHQPSATVFRGFKRLLLLSQGKVAYAGKVDECVAYMASIGRVMPSQENPADFMLTMVNADFIEKEKVDEVIDAWGKRLQRQLSSDKPVPVTDASNITPPFGPQFITLLHRQIVVSVRDPLVYIARMIAFCFFCCFFSLVYFKARDRKQEQALPRCWLYVWIECVPLMMTIVFVLTQNLEWRAIKREVKQGMYMVTPYVIAQTLVQVPYVILMSLASVGPAGYGISQWRGAAFHKNLLLHSLIHLNYEAFAQLGAVIWGHPIIGMLQLVCLWFAGFLFGGWLIAEEKIIWPLRAMAIINPMKYSTRSMLYNEFHDTEWEGAHPIATSPYFDCDSQLPAPCLGYTGDQVRTSIEASVWPGLPTDDRMLQDCMIILGVTLGYKFLVWAAMMWFSRGRPAVKPDPNAAISAHTVGKPN